MKFPYYVHAGDVTLLLHSIIEPLAFFCGFRFFLLLKKKKSDVLPSQQRFWIILAAIIGAFLGSRLVGGLEEPGAINSDNWLTHFLANKTVLGGLLGGLFAVEALKKLMKITEASGDLFVYPLILAMIIGRIGCFSMGVYEDTVGVPTHLFTGMDLGDGIKRHPVTLYEILFLVALWICLRWIARKKPVVNGALFKIFMMSYIIFRFVLEYIKPHHDLAGGLSAIQVACILGMAWYLQYLIHPAKLFHQKKTVYA